ncbi:AAA family ATPase [bacterium]|nr:AAA family ATPase [bacterium]
MTDLFSASDLEGDAPRPLADRLRPERIDQIVGQDHVLGSDGPIGRMLAKGRLASVILWGPPGVGKTSIARLLARDARLEFEQLSAVFSGVKDLREVFERAEQRRKIGKGTLLFVDEIHRFNRAQQDGFLPFVERGVVTLIGATTENPSFELNSALLSRCRVVVLNRLEAAALDELLRRSEAHFGRSAPLTEEGKRVLYSLADGDGRYFLNLVEEVFAWDGPPMGPDELQRILTKRSAAYDRDREEHYNLISALHKSIRGSDPDAALYWFARMLKGGEDPLFLGRRLIRMASEDIGLADPQSLLVAQAAAAAYERLGSPEGELALAQAVLHLAAAPKSNAAYFAFKSAIAAAEESGSLPPPPHILNAPTQLMREMRRGADYVYDHDLADGFSGQDYFPEGMDRRGFYAPTDRGEEKRLQAHLMDLADRRRRRNDP